MKRVILHSDLNCYYASVEMNEHPELKGKKIAVCGSTENRHGIVLTASYPAKRCGVKTGMANWQAKQACPDLIAVSPHYDLYSSIPGSCEASIGGFQKRLSLSVWMKAGFLSPLPMMSRGLVIRQQRASGTLFLKRQA